jgi:dephospho-CoA kinase
MVIVEIPKDEKTDEILDSLTEHLTELKSETSELRKKGLDTKMIELMMIDVLPKIRLARTTYEQKDVDSVKKSLAMIRDEIDSVQVGTDFDAALESIQNAYEFIREGNYPEALKIYLKLRDVYKKLPEEMRKIVYVASLDIHKKIMKAQE